jgi:hypothetical protein
LSTERANVNAYLKPWPLDRVEELAEAINGEEASGSQFLGNVVAVVEGAPTNLVKFRRLAPGETESRVVHVAGLADAVPPGRNHVWSGAVLIGATSTAVRISR